MQVVIRADASVALGSGHVMRCLTLADALRAGGAGVGLVCRVLPGDLNDYAEKQGYPVMRLAPGRDVPADAGIHSELSDAAATLQKLPAGAPLDWLVVDSYALGATWERELRPWARHILVIDDLAYCAHDCDFLLDQNLYPGMKGRYQGLTPPECRRLLGPRFALLRPQFAEAAGRLRRQGRLVRDGNVRRVLMFFGGSDEVGATLVAWRAWQSLGRPDIALDVVVGGANPRGDEVRAAVSAVPNARFHCQVSDMASLMAAADLALGAGGATTWERCSLGLPTIALAIADNQRAVLAAAAEMGVLTQLDSGRQGQADWRQAQEAALAQPATLQAQSLAGLAMMGVSLNDEVVERGGAETLADIMHAMAGEA